jgi:hypothetical protein
MGLTLNANLDEMRELAKALSDESSACDALRKDRPPFETSRRTY